MSDRRVLLALETSSAVGSVAVGCGQEVLARGWLLRRGEHASALIPQIAATLEEAGVKRENVEGLLVGRGPGSFTGLRIAAATARGLAKALGVPLWHFSSLAAGAASLDVEMPESLSNHQGVASSGLSDMVVAWPRYVLLDAGSDRVYAACYGLLPDRIATLIEPTASTLSDVLGAWIPESSLFCGDTALRHAAVIADAGHAVLPFPAGLPTAEGLLRVHRLSVGEEPVSGRSQWEPEYLRASSAARPAVSRGIKA